MTERSRYWDGTSVGDAASVAPYDAATEFAVVQASITQAFALSNRGGVLRDQLSELAPTNPLSNTVQIASGRGFVYGTWYENDSALNVTVPTPATSTRVDRIVLRKDWVAQTVRVTRIAGTEGAGTPSLVQSAGVTWDTPLCNASITTGGTITLTDTREWVPPHLSVVGESGTMHSLSQLSDLAAPNATPTTVVPGGGGTIGASGRYADQAHVHPMSALVNGDLPVLDAVRIRELRLRTAGGSLSNGTAFSVVTLTDLQWAVGSGETWSFLLYLADVTNTAGATVLLRIGNVAGSGIVMATHDNGGVALVTGAIGADIIVGAGSGKFLSVAGVITTGGAGVAALLFTVGSGQTVAHGAGFLRAWKDVLS